MNWSPSIGWVWFRVSGDQHWFSNIKCATPVQAASPSQPVHDQWFSKILSIFVPCDLGAFELIAWVGSGSVFLAGWFGSCFSNVQRQLKVHHLLGFLLRVLVWLLCLSQQVPVKKFSVSREWSRFGFGASRKSAVAMALNKAFKFIPGFALHPTAPAAQRFNASVMRFQ